MDLRGVIHELLNAFPVYYHPTPQGWRELVAQDGEVTDRIIGDLGY